jgi:hypothetical protein
MSAFRGTGSGYSRRQPRVVPPGFHRAEWRRYRLPSSLTALHQGCARASLGEADTVINAGVNHSDPSSSVSILGRAFRAGRSL